MKARISSSGKLVCNVYEMPKLESTFMNINNQICLTIAQVRAFITLYYRATR